MIKKNVFVLKNILLRYKAFKKYKNLLSNDKLSFDDLDKLNFEKRKRLVEFAYANIPFYKSFYDSNNFNPQQLIEPKDWNLVPVLTKQHIKDNFNSFVVPSVDKRRCITSSTG